MHAEIAQADQPGPLLPIRARLETLLPGFWGRNATLRSWLSLAVMTLVILIGSATWWGYRAVNELTRTVTAQLENVQRDAALSLGIETAIEQWIEAGRDHLATGSAASLARYEARNAEVDELIARQAALAAPGAAEAATLRTVAETREAVDSGFRSALDLIAAGRLDETAGARAAIDAAATALAAELRPLAEFPATRLAVAARDLQRIGAQAQLWLLVVFFSASMFTIVLLAATLAIVNRPLTRLREATAQLGEGNLSVRFDGSMLREFRTLGETFNDMAARLREFVRETNAISDHVALSALDLASISDQVATSSGQVAAAMDSITKGAEAQAARVAGTSAALRQLQTRGAWIEASTARIGDLGEEIRRVAERHRDGMATVVRALSEARGIAERPESEARDLEDTARAAESALDQIAATLADVTRSAAEVNEAVLTDREAIEQVERALVEVADAAATHAASALQVATAAEHQSAATAQVSSASAWMHSSASRMKDLISGLRT